MDMNKIEKKLPKSVREEMNGMDSVALKNCVVQSAETIRQVLDELSKSPEYAAAKEAVADLSAGAKEVKGYQNAKIAYALYLLQDVQLVKE